jgi:AraC-like DNA-binding protein
MQRMQKLDRFEGASAFPVVIQRHDMHREVGEHDHDFMELVVITGGLGYHFTGGRQYEIRAGDVFVISGKRAHGYGQSRDLQLINILVDSERLELPENDLKTLPGYHALFTLEPAYRQHHGFASRLRLSTAQLARLQGLIDTLEEELVNQESGYQFLATAAYMRLVGYLARCYSEQPEPSSRRLLQIAEAIGRLEKNYASEIDLDSLARMAHMSVRNFQRVFQECMGDSPIRYLIRTRVLRSAELLRQTDKNVSEIGFDVGFKDNNYFARQFKKIMSCSPTAYRKQYST